MGKPNENVERLNRTIAHVENNILPWLKGRLGTAQQVGRNGSPELAQQEGSNIRIVAEFYRDKLRIQAADAGANGNSLPADQGRFGEVNKKLDEVMCQTAVMLLSPPLPLTAAYPRF